MRRSFYSGAKIKVKKKVKNVINFTTHFQSDPKFDSIDILIDYKCCNLCFVSVEYVIEVFNNKAELNVKFNY